MIRERPVTGPLLFVYERDDAGPLDPALLRVVVDYDDEGIPWLRGMVGLGFGPQVYAELISYFHARGCLAVRANRAPGHTLPGAEDKGDYWEWDIPRLHRMMVSRGRLQATKESP